MVDPSTDEVSVEQAVRLTGLSESYLRRLARTGEVEARQDDRRRWWLSTTSLDRLRPDQQDAAPATWEMERDLVYAENAQLSRQLLEQQLEQLRADNALLRADNARLRAALRETLDLGSIEA